MPLEVEKLPLPSLNSSHHTALAVVSIILPPLIIINHLAEACSSSLAALRRICVFPPALGKPHWIRRDAAGRRCAIEGLVGSFPFTCVLVQPVSPPRLMQPQDDRPLLPKQPLLAPSGWRSPTRCRTNSWFWPDRHPPPGSCSHPQ